MSEVHGTPRPADVEKAVMARLRESPDAASFRQIFEALFDDLVRFVQRRTDEAAVDDVVADTFVVAWRRLAELPSDTADVRPWLFAVARRRRRADRPDHPSGRRHGPGRGACLRRVSLRHAGRRATWTVTAVRSIMRASPHACGTIGA